MIFKTDGYAKPQNRHFGYKLCRLLSFLNNTSYGYEKVAEEMQDKDERMALLSIATETRQYATELSAQLQCLDVPFLSAFQNFDRNTISAYINAMTTPEEKHDLSALCYENEHCLLDAYKDVLNEGIPFPFLKQIIFHQFTGIKGAFMKLRLMDLIQPKSYDTYITHLQ